MQNTVSNLSVVTFKKKSERTDAINFNIWVYFTQYSQNIIFTTCSQENITYVIFYTPFLLKVSAVWGRVSSQSTAQPRTLCPESVRQPHMALGRQTGQCVSSVS